LAANAPTKAPTTVLRSRYVVTGGHRTHYTEAGDNGPVIVALHGGGAGSSGAAGMGGLMPYLSDAFRIVAVDGVGGYGFTDPGAPANFGIHSRVNQLEAVVDTLGLERFFIMGNSQGAWIAAKYAILHPDRVEKMVLVASGSIADAMGIEEKPTPAMAALTGYDFTRPGMVRLLEALVTDHSRITDELVDSRYQASIRPGVREAMKQHRDGMAVLKSPAMRWNYDMRVSLPAITKEIPTILFWGENDKFAPVHLGHQLEPMLPDVKFHFIANAGHQAQTDRPDVMAPTIRAFLGAE